MLVTIIIFVVVLGLLVFVHELGHFIVARRFGVRVDEFGFGFPPRLFGIRRGETLYSINLIPLGGFVRIKGEAGDNSADTDSFSHKKAWQRSSILAAGVAMNFIFAFVILSVGFMIGTPQEVSDEDIATRAVRDINLVIIDVAKGSAGDEAGLRPGDRLRAINGIHFSSVDDATNYIKKHNTETLQVSSSRGDSLNDFDIQPRVISGSETPVIGIGMIRAGLVTYNFFEAWWRGARATISLVYAILLAFGALIAGLFRGTGVGDQISGPVGVAVLTGQIAKLGVPYLINFTAMLSINLGILNIIPFPALDGGRVLFIVIEKIKGRPLNPRIESVFHSIGFFLLIALVAFITYKDVTRYGIQILNSFTGLIN
ncbi:MAG: RIP metalloprotease RseP [Patescibacteria group bacterium]